jgi:outer membrane lipoprotein-sorting protein
MVFKVVFLLALSGASLAQAEPLTPADSALVQRATAYLQHLTTAQGRFTQTNPRGQTVTGTFVLQRPGKARFDYDPPSGLTIASDGHRVAVLDRRLKTIQASPLGLTPLSLFLAKDIRLDRGVTVANVTHTPGGFTVVARDARKKTQGQIALDFAESPIALTGWTITDAGGGVTRVRLTDFAASPPRDSAFFVLQDPRPAPAAPVFN